MRIIFGICTAITSLIIGTSVQAQPLSGPSAPKCTETTRECILTSTNAYLEALISHDANHVPFAQDAQRWENGVNTGSSGEAIRNSINHDYAMKSVHDIRDVRWIVDGDQAMGFYLVDLVVPYTTIHVGTTRIASRFKVTEGWIKEIEVVFCNSPGTTPEAREIPSRTPLSFVCTRAFV